MLELSWDVFFTKGIVPEVDHFPFLLDLETEPYVYLKFLFEDVYTSFGNIGPTLFLMMNDFKILLAYVISPDNQIDFNQFQNAEFSNLREYNDGYDDGYDADIVTEVEQLLFNKIETFKQYENDGTYEFVLSLPFILNGDYYEQYIKVLEELYEKTTIFPWKDKLWHLDGFVDFAKDMSSKDQRFSKYFYRLNELEYAT